MNPVRATGALRFPMAALNRHLSYRTLTPQQELRAFSNGVKYEPYEKRTLKKWLFVLPGNDAGVHKKFKRSRGNE